MLILKNIKKIYKTKNANHVALNNISLNFRKNEFVSVLGSSGSGKSTLLNIIGGLDSYDYGDLYINGKSTKYFTDKDWDSYRNNNIGFIFQDYNLINHISIYQNVELKLSLTNIKKKRKKVLNILKQVGLENVINKKPNELSGGQMQRIAIARSLVNNPDIILADEPTGALDKKNSIQIMNLIKKISKKRLVIMVTHDEELAKKYSDRIIKIKDGKVKSDSNPCFSYSYDKNSNLKKTKLKFFTALKLSFNNLKSKWGRTFLISFSSSIGLIGIGLILSISNGLKKEINSYNTETISLFPIIISNGVIKNENNEKTYNDSFLKRDKLYSYNILEDNNIHKNNITKEYLKYIENINKRYLNNISYYRLTNFNLIIKGGNNYKFIDNSKINFKEIPISFNYKSYLETNYDLLKGDYPKNSNELVLIVDEENRVDEGLLKELFINDKQVDYNEILKKEIKLLSNNSYYKKVNNNTFIKEQATKEIYENNTSETLKIVGILKPKKNNQVIFTENNDVNINGVSKIGYSSNLIKKIIKANEESEIVKAQLNSNKSLINYNLSKEDSLKVLGENDLPESIYLYPKNSNSKKKIINYLNNYNKVNKDKVLFTDYSDQINNLTNKIMDGITITLVFFSSISLIVTSLMIGIITYMSVTERIKEIGILRSLGARKKDIFIIFNTEVVIIGVISGIISILSIKLFLLVINKILYNLTGIKKMGIISLENIIFLIFISVFLSFIAGYVPSFIASKKTPFSSLRKN